MIIDGSRVLFLLVLLCVNVTVVIGQSTEGTDFWLGCMQHVDKQDAKHALIISTREETRGTVTIEEIGFQEDFTVRFDSGTVIMLPSQVQNIGSEKINDLGIHVTSELPVHLYVHQYSDFRSDASLVLPTSVLSGEYYTINYTGHASTDEDEVSEFLIVATEDNTLVRYVPSAITKNNRPANLLDTIRLDQGQTYQVRARTKDDDLTGSYINADKPVAVFSGSSWATVPVDCQYSDFLLEQMPPYNTWGTQYITGPTGVYTEEYDILRIFSAVGNNEVRLSAKNGIVDTLVNENSFVEINIYEPLLIESEEPILVCHYTKGEACSNRTNGDPAMHIVRPLHQLTDTVNLYTSTLQEINGFISVVSPLDGEEEVKLDNVSYGNWQTIGDYSYLYIPVAPGGDHKLTSERCGLLVNAYGFGDKQAYSYSGGGWVADFQKEIVTDGGCFGVPTIFELNLLPARYVVEWDIGDGVPVTDEFSFTHNYSSPGTYSVRVSIHDKCFEREKIVEKEVVISRKQKVDLEDDLVLCHGEDHVIEVDVTSLDVPEDAVLEFLWYRDDLFELDNAMPFYNIDDAKSEDSGLYKVIASISGCQSFPDSINVNVQPRLELDLGKDTVICERENPLNLVLYAGDHSAYLWNDGSENKELDVFQEGIFSVEVFDEVGCSVSDSIIITEVCPPSIYQPNVLLFGDSYNGVLGIYSDGVVSAKLYVYDRYGGLVFESINMNEVWTGSDEIEQGVYTYLIEFTAENTSEIQRVVGNVILLR